MCFKVSDESAFYDSQVSSRRQVIRRRLGRKLASLRRKQLESKRRRRKEPVASPLVKAIVKPVASLVAESVVNACERFVFKVGPQNQK